MKIIKMLGLAAVAAAALMAFVGAGVASASHDTVLCKKNVHPCRGADVYGQGTQIHAELATGHATLKAGFANITCESSTVAGDTQSTTTPKGAIDVLKFEKCNATVNVLNNGSLQIHHTSGNKGNLVVEGTEVEVAIGSTSCVYGGKITTGLTVTGGSPASMVANEASIPKLAGGFLCASPAKWTAHYKITQPNPLHISTETEGH